MTSIKSLKSLNLLRKCSMSTQAQSKLVRPPVPMFGIDGRYAIALYSAASKQNKLDQVDSNLKKLLELHEKDVQFKDFLFNPLVKPKEKKKILSESLKSKLNLEELTINLLVLMAENNRMKYLPSMARLFNKTMAFSRGEMTVNVTASSALDEATKKELQTILEGKKFLINIKIDKSILGGLIVDFDGEHFIDLSLRKKFIQYSDILRQPI
ncbi:ATP synthase subunit O [Sarcoptes scabiei]|nr:ATP synthase subunit O [Sarcoptes scabiei]